MEDAQGGYSTCSIDPKNLKTRATAGTGSALGNYVINAEASSPGGKRKIYSIGQVVIGQIETDIGLNQYAWSVGKAVASTIERVGTEKISTENFDIVCERVVQ